MLNEAQWRAVVPPCQVAEYQLSFEERTIELCSACADDRVRRLRGAPCLAYCVRGSVLGECEDCACEP